MSAEVHNESACELTLDLAEAELRRLLSDTRFRVSDRQRDILVYLAKRRFDGHRENVKAYSIALDVLGRSSDFDASIDPIVRIEISRLRTALDGYYSLFGPDLGVTIHIPKGSYVTLFLSSPVGGDEEQEAVAFVPQQLGANPSRSATRSRYGHLRILAAIGFLAAVAVGLGWKSLSDSTFTSKPTLTLSIYAVSPDLADDASATRDALMTALSQFNTLVVAKAGYSTAVHKGRYDLTLKYYSDSDDSALWWEVADASDGRLIKAGLEKVDLEGKVPAMVRLELAGAVARKIASARGVINSMIISEAPMDATGNACVARADAILDSGDVRGRAAAVNCLEQTLAQKADDPDASAALARLYSLEPQKAAASLELAKAAVSTAPTSDRGQLALMAARFANGRLDAAIDAGNRAMVLNPNNSGAVASLALVLFSAGYWDAASSLAREAAVIEETTPGDAALVLALEAYRKHNWSEASLLADQSLGNNPLTLSIRAAALGQLGSREAAKRAEDTDLDEETFRKATSNARLPADLIMSLESGLAKAGARFDAVASVSGR